MKNNHCLAPHKHSSKILIAPIEVAGYYSNLAITLADLDYKVDHVTFENHRFGYKTLTKRPLLLSLALYFRSQSRFLPTFFKIPTLILSHVFSSTWSIYAIFYYDIFIFGFGQSLLWRNLDLYLISFLNKRIVAVFHGSDCRPPYADGAIHHPEDPARCKSPRELFLLSKNLRNKIRLYESLDITIIGNPLPFSPYAMKPFVNFLAIGLPVISHTNLQDSCERFLPSSGCTNISSNTSTSFTIIHAPSDPLGKGTAQIRASIQELISLGFRINYKELVSLANASVLSELSTCDVVVDQVFSDFPMAGLAAEAASLGKPTIVSGYSLDYLQSLVPSHMWPPSIICKPSDLTITIAWAISNPEKLATIGSLSRDFVSNVWSSSAFAHRFLAVIFNEVPPEHYINPFEISYIEGYGQSLQQLQLSVRSVVRRYGLPGLHLSHRPDLEHLYSKLTSSDIV